MKLTLKDKKQEAEDVFTLFFIPEELVSWVAGQSIRLELPTGSYDIEERRFTISAAPHEEIIAITTRTTPGLFKQSLLELKPGSTLQAGAIEGDFIWKESGKLHIFIAGGIGITPFYAMLKNREYNKLSLDAHLLYAGYEPGLPFLQQFRIWQQKHSEFKMTHVDRHIELNDIINTTDNYIYISGPSPMVTALQDKLLDGRRVPPHLIKTDQFTGYKQF